MAASLEKTAVVAILIAWHILDKLANSQDSRFSDAFLIVTPDITIRDRPPASVILSPPMA